MEGKDGRGQEYTGAWQSLLPPSEEGLLVSLSPSLPKVVTSCPVSQWGRGWVEAPAATTGDCRDCCLLKVPPFPPCHLESYRWGEPSR